jgi:hypothetical protein
MSQDWHLNKAFRQSQLDISLISLLAKIPIAYT